MSRDEMSALKVRVSDTRRDEAWVQAYPRNIKVLRGLAAADPYAHEAGHRAGAARRIAARQPRYMGPAAFDFQSGACDGRLPRRCR
jgi:hypothetical protein